MQLKSGISQDRVETELGERWPDPTQGHARIDRPAAEDESSDHHVLRCPDKTASADVGQLRISCAVGVVDFHESNSGALVLAGKNRGVSPGLKSDGNS